MIVLISILVIIIDQLTKVLFSRILTLNNSIPVIKNFFHLTLVYNTGIAFGILKGSSGIILIATIIGLILIIYSLKKDFLSQGQSLSRKTLFIRKMAIGFILGGAIGNMIDRLHLGYVVDFLDFRIWPVFNLADSFITVGAVILFWSLFISHKSQKT
ncbi:MAG: signal peptidase II [Candidatus Omnitrophica bacterium]|nr:signal peptidase II [Candidatus Omnitrophota bacterium]MDD5550377.1 signal peptidase II [Candidatus Omnitrophota bacterium]